MGRFFNAAANSLSSCRTENSRPNRQVFNAAGFLQLLFHEGNAGEYAGVRRAIARRRWNARLSRLFSKARMHQLIGNRNRNFPAELLPDPFQHHVDDRRPAGTCHAIPVNLEKRLHGMHAKKTFTKSRQAFPMASGAIAIEHASTRKNKWACVDSSK